jgi:hypothetical protein
MRGFWSAWRCKIDRTKSKAVQGTIDAAKLATGPVTATSIWRPFFVTQVVGIEMRRANGTRAP